MMNSKKRIRALIEILFDATARDDERDDAAQYLSQFDDDKALEALIEASTGESVFDPSILQTCGEGVAEIWIKRDAFDEEAYSKLTSQARLGVYHIILGHRPEWINTHNIQRFPN